eukprot:878940-Amphidinium_carterae.2
MQAIKTSATDMYSHGRFKEQRGVSSPKRKSMYSEALKTQHVLDSVFPRFHTVYPLFTSVKLLQVLCIPYQ